MPDPTYPPVAVLGLGPMGSALARALLAAGVPTTVWNRSPERAGVLRAEGATVAPGVPEAVVAADLLLVCLRDHEAARAVLAGADPAAYAGRTVVNLSSSTPEQARSTAAWAGERGIGYLSAAIMVPTPLVGSAEALILYSGDRELFDRHVTTLRVLAGEADHLGEDHGRAALSDTAMLEVFFAGMTAFLHAAALVTAQGVPAADFLPYARHVVSVLPDTLGGLAVDVDAGTHPGTEDTLAMDLAALEHIAATTGETGLDRRLPELMRDLAQDAVTAGYGADGYSRVVQVLRRGTDHRAPGREVA